MRKLIALLLVLLPFVGAANAQEAKIAFVNTQEVFMALPEVADMRKQIDDLNANYQKELETMQNEFQKKYSDFIAQQDSLTENIKVRRMQEVEDLRQRMDNFVQVAQQDVNKKQQELIAPIQQKMADAIKAVGTEQGYTYIIDPQVLLYTGPNAIDATPFVKTKLGLQ
ncbi:MAG TPA: OmpH family outer membrane protein [Candidatus Parabacteroides intestinavium]|nr:OmpH family outer membrane protein [Candidatus Parabacteroides intestinavium]